MNSNDIINSLYINSDVNATDFTNTLARFNTYLNIKELDKKQDIFKQSDLLKENILSLSEYSSKSIDEVANNLFLNMVDMARLMPSLYRPYYEHRPTIYRKTYTNNTSFDTL